MNSCIDKDDFDCIDGPQILSSGPIFSQLQTIADICPLVIKPSSPSTSSCDDLSPGNSLSSSESLPPALSQNNVCAMACPLAEESWDLASTDLLTPVASKTSSATNSPLVRELVELANAPFEESQSSTTLRRADSDMLLEGSVSRVVVFAYSCFNLFSLLQECVS